MPQSVPSPPPPPSSPSPSHDQCTTIVEDCEDQLLMSDGKCQDNACHSPPKAVSLEKKSPTYSKKDSSSIPNTHPIKHSSNYGKLLSRSASVSHSDQKSPIPPYSSMVIQSYYIVSLLFLY